MQHSAPSPAPANAAPRDRIQMFLLACGIIAPLIYAGSDLVAGSRWQGYSFTDQTISELNAIGSPTRAITVVMGLAGYVLLIAFGTGVWRSARGDRRLRTL